MRRYDWRTQRWGELFFADLEKRLEGFDPPRPRLNIDPRRHLSGPPDAYAELNKVIVGESIYAVVAPRIRRVELEAYDHAYEIAAFYAEVEGHPIAQEIAGEIQLKCQTGDSEGFGERAEKFRAFAAARRWRLDDDT